MALLKGAKTCYVLLNETRRRISRLQLGSIAMLWCGDSTSHSLNVLKRYIREPFPPAR